MASAFKKFFKTADRLSDEGGVGGGGRKSTGTSGSPVHHPRRFFGHHCSPRNSRRDSKIVPVETGPMSSKNGTHNLLMNQNQNQNHNQNNLHLNNNGNGPGGTGNANGLLGGERGGGGGTAASCGLLFKPKSTSKSNGNSMTDTMVKHNQAVRTRRLMKEFNEIAKYGRMSDNPPFTVELVEDNLYEWNIRLFQIDPESDLFRDMQESGHESILLNVAFPDNFPFSPPFMRVITPHIEKGFVMEGGAICMELLTPRGWASAYTVEAVVMQFAASLVKGQGRVARKCKSGKEFNRKLAEASFRSLVKTHEKYGWVTPPLADG